MWLINSSIGKKVLMSVTGMALILFLTFHACMNVVALIDGDAYNMVCEFLGTNWYALVGTAALAALAVVHILYAVILTLENRKARGNNRYAVTAKPEKVEWASQNMFVLGVIVILGLFLHLYNFWFNMMFAELVGMEGMFAPTDGYAFIQQTFSCPVTAVLYLIWLAALWFHLSHGFWSSLQTLGLSGKTWFCRWKLIGIIWVSVVIILFAVVVLAFALCPDCAGSYC
ncbi:MAG: succinate dehydrogenase/fumarate reductase cytochrome b subunit [Prevotellaceae bacterium]|nr:succinate dehydrogenase/fumarate reductase cytochrome b subunit [Prevotellaceae bacterium]MDD7106967.1 succinate dehydrogenase/fumarate reductase cytochrome b subunit [Prevotellaceae bacterium]MDY3295840.1 succinate dehydrogenase/fumarate reductase cytochrome b subunit [Bacteroidaceae bacterium]